MGKQLIMNLMLAELSSEIRCNQIFNKILLVKIIIIFVNNFVVFVSEVFIYLFKNKLVLLFSKGALNKS